MVSPIPMLPSPLVSAILAALVNVMDEDGGGVVVILVIVGSFSVYAGLRVWQRQETITGYSIPPSPPWMT